MIKLTKSWEEIDAMRQSGKKNTDDKFTSLVAPGVEYIGDTIVSLTLVIAS